MEDPKKSEFIEQLFNEVTDFNKLLIKKKNSKIFNVFEIEGIDHKEVPMCRFLRAILDPNGGHNKGNKFLLSFAKEVLKIEEELPEDGNYVVEREEVIEGNRRIDLLIKGNGFWIPIEAKIYAKDGFNQCKDYLEYANTKTNKATLFYLTPTGKKPGKESAPESKEIKCISWGDIKSWLEGFCEDKLDTKDSDLNLCLKQYCDAISNFIENTKMEKDMKDLMCREEDTLKASATIYQNYNNVKTLILREFFDVLDVKLSKMIEAIDGKGENKILGDKILYENLKDCIDGYYDYKKSTYPSITYPFVKSSELLTKVLGEDRVLTIRIEIGEELWIGLCIPRKVKKADGYKYEYINKLPINYDELKKKLDYEKAMLIEDWEVNLKDWWLAWNYVGFDGTDTPVNFKDNSIENENYFRLAKRENIEKLADSCCQKFEKIFNCIKDIIG